jgi:hypothetical protein
MRDLTVSWMVPVASAVNFFHGIIRTDWAGSPAIPCLNGYNPQNCFL